MEDLKDEKTAEHIRNAAGDLKSAGSKTASRVRSAGENAYEEVSEAVDEAADEGKQGVAVIARNLRSAANKMFGGAWSATKQEIERKPLQCVAIALAAGIVVGGILTSRD